MDPVKTLEQQLQKEERIVLYVFQEGSYYEKADLYYTKTMFHDDKEPKYFVSKQALDNHRLSVISRLEKDYTETVDDGHYCHRRADNDMYYIRESSVKVLREDIVTMRGRLYYCDEKQGRIHRIYGLADGKVK